MTQNQVIWDDVDSVNRLWVWQRSCGGETVCLYVYFSSLLGCCLQLVGILLSQILINQIKDQIELQKYNSQHRADPWYWMRSLQSEGGDAGFHYRLRGPSHRWIYSPRKDCRTSGMAKRHSARSGVHVLCPLDVQMLKLVVLTGFLITSFSVTVWNKFTCFAIRSILWRVSRVQVWSTMSHYNCGAVSSLLSLSTCSCPSRSVCIRCN